MRPDWPSQYMANPVETYHSQRASHMLALFLHVETVRKQAEGPPSCVAEFVIAICQFSTIRGT